MAQAHSCPLTLPRPGTLAVCCGLRPCTTTVRTKTRQPRKIRPMLSVKLPSQTYLRRSPTRTWLRPDPQTAQTREVAENTRAGTNLGARVAASDPDVLTYSLLDSGNPDDADGVRHQPGRRVS